MISDELLAHVEQLARVVRADVVVADNVAELSNERGVFARASGDDTLALRTGRHPGDIARRELGDGWWEVDPWPAGVTFRRGPDLLRDAVRQAARHEPA